MTGPEHYQAAEKLAAKAQDNRVAGDSVWSAQMSAEAQVHATLALAAATAIRPDVTETNSTAAMDSWSAVAG